MALLVTAVASGCGQLGGVHGRVTSAPVKAFTASTADRVLVGYILQTSVVHVHAPTPSSARPGGRIVVVGVLDYLALYQRASAECPGLPWTVLAAIGTVESNNGQSNAPGVHSGANFAGAEGPMQMLPRSFAAYALPVPSGGATPPSPYDPVDAVYAATRYLCAGGGRGAANLPGAIFAYNQAGWYVTEVLQLAANYGRAARP